MSVSSEKLDVLKTCKIVREVGSLHLWRKKPGALRALERFEVGGGMKKVLFEVERGMKKLLKAEIPYKSLL